MGSHNDFSLSEVPRGDNQLSQRLFSLSGVQREIMSSPITVFIVRSARGVDRLSQKLFSL